MTNAAVPRQAALDEVRLRGVTKNFNGVFANSGIDLTLRRGEVHAVLGENGAGKTTLMNILSGLYHPDAGEIEVWGEKLRLGAPGEAARRGVGMVHQHFQLVDAFSVLDNILLAGPEGSPLLRRAGAARKLADVARAHGLHVEPAAHVWQLAVGERQKVEILKLLYHGAELLLLDEPTSVLTPAEAEDLYRALRAMADAGKAIVFITHRLNEVMSAADRITVLRHGRVVASRKRAEVTLRELSALMVGTEIEQYDEASLPRSISSEVVLQLEKASANGDRTTNALDAITLELRQGEILGVAGVAGNGQRELAEAMAGLRPLRRGRMTLGGRDITRASAHARMKAGLRFVPEDRTGMGLVPQLDIADNLMLRDYREQPLSRGIWLNRSEARDRAAAVIRDFGIHAGGSDAPVWALSGGNQQKVLLGRELLAHPLVLIVAQPTRGLDIAATRGVHDRLSALRATGAAILLISEDLDEVLQMADRVAVMYRGRIPRIWTREEADRHAIGNVMGGHLLEETG